MERRPRTDRAAAEGELVTSLEVRDGLRPGQKYYLMNQQGAAGAIRLVQNAQAAADLVGESAVVENGGSSSTSAAAFVPLWARNYAAS